MSDEFDLNAIVLIGAAFVVGYLVVGAIMSRGKRGRRRAAPKAPAHKDTASDPLSTAAERESQMQHERDAEYQRVQDAAQKMRDQAAARAQEEQRRRGG
jgi:hypothetical protein